MFAQILKHLNKVDQELLSYDVSYISPAEKAVCNLLMMESEKLVFLSAAEAAKQCHLSYTHFNRIFLRLDGMTFHQHTVLARISLAEKLLVTTNKTVAEIARDVNFSSDSFFVKQFRDLMGITPGKYRAEKKKTLSSYNTPLRKVFCPVDILHVA